MKSSQTLQNVFKKLLSRKRRPMQMGGGLLCLLVIFLVSIFLPDGLLPEEKQLPHPSPPLAATTKKSSLKEGTWPVVHVVDGDTLDVVDDNQMKHRIRLIGADTPEIVKPNAPPQPFGKEASTFTKKMIADSNQQVRIAFDGDQIDRYGRNLAMVYVKTPRGEVNLSEELIRQGLARPRLQYRFSKEAKQRMEKAAGEAQKANRGLWAERP